LFFTIYPGTLPCGGLNCGVDFKGGNLIELSTEPNEVDLGAIREGLAGLGLGDVQVQNYSVPVTDPTGRYHAMVRFETPEGAEAQENLALVQQELRQDLGENITFSRTEIVGAKVSGELLTN